MAAYDYIVPGGAGDQFYMYAYDAGSLTDGSSYSGLQIPVDNYDFIARHWAGWETVIDTPANGGSVQAYDDIKRQYANLPLAFGSFPQGQVILPEKMYRVNSAIKFDLAKVLRANNSGVYASQLVWTGVRRIPGQSSDPAPSPVNFKLVRQYYPYTLVVQQSPVAEALYSIPITDYDFQLERVEMTPYSSPSKFAIRLFDNNKIARSNVPINCNRFFHLNPNGSGGQLNFWPSPPVLYRVNSSINFGITSRIGAGGSLTFQLLFVGSRRIPCQ